MVQGPWVWLKQHPLVLFLPLLVSWNPLSTFHHRLSITATTVSVPFHILVPSDAEATTLSHAMVRALSDDKTLPLSHDSKVPTLSKVKILTL